MCLGCEQVTNIKRQIINIINMSQFVDFEFVFKTLAWHLNFELLDGFIEFFWTFIAFESGI